eukprot:TRINITY_DN4181_c0_g1_i1.p1 TRINITY_DN4181_c0_g1~~TRINITY_DN4181_c0_g1_i1.p1  ORF type:complete len:597 (-),score=118.01 TRINITY_DN4181_c0_g1_i1:241-2031(-)
MHSSASTKDSDTESVDEAEKVRGFQRVKQGWGAFNVSNLLKRLDRKETELQEAREHMVALELELERSACKEAELQQTIVHVAALELELERSARRERELQEKLAHVAALELERSNRKETEFKESREHIAALELELERSARKETELQGTREHVAALELKLERLACKEIELEKAREHVAALEFERAQCRVNHEALYENAEELITLEREQHRLDMEALQHQLDEAHELLARARSKNSQAVLPEARVEAQAEEQAANADASEARCAQWRAIYEALEQECAQLREQLDTLQASRDAADVAAQQDVNTTIDLQRQVEQQTARADELEHCCKELRSRAAELEQDCASMNAALRKTMKALQAALMTIVKSTEDDKVDDAPSFVGADMVCDQASAAFEEAKCAVHPRKRVKFSLEARVSNAVSGFLKHESCSVNEDAAETAWDEVQEPAQLAAAEKEEALDSVDYREKAARIAEELQARVDNFLEKLAQLALESENAGGESLRRLSHDFRHGIACSLQTWSELIKEVQGRYAGFQKELGDSNGFSHASEESEVQRLRAKLLIITSLKERADDDIEDLQAQVGRLIQELKAARRMKAETGKTWFCTR